MEHEGSYLINVSHTLWDEFSHSLGRIWDVELFRLLGGQNMIVFSAPDLGFFQVSVGLFRQINE